MRLIFPTTIQLPQKYKKQYRRARAQYSIYLSYLHSRQIMTNEVVQSHLSSLSSLARWWLDYFSLALFFFPSWFFLFPRFFYIGEN